MTDSKVHPLLLKQLKQFLATQITPVESVIGNHSAKALLQHVEWNLRHCRAEGIVRTLMFILDASMYSHPAQDEFYCEMDQSTVWEVFGELLYHRNGNVRSNTIYTIGRLGCWRRAGLLRRAFPHYLRTDLINLCGLMSEMRTFNKSWLLGPAGIDLGGTSLSP